MIPITKPTLPEFREFEGMFNEVMDSGILTNGKYVQMLESRAAEYLGVDHVVAVSSCTLGLVLTHQALGLTGSVIMPSFTFSATPHSLVWNGLQPLLADSDLLTFNLDIALAEEAITSQTSAILAVDIFGNPCDREQLKNAANRHGLKLVIDSAHGMGSLYRGKPLGGWADAEIFSLSPTKVMVAGEGGLVATNDDMLAGQLKKARNYGDPGNYNCEFAGLNARMSEFHAIVAIKSLERLEENARARNSLINMYKELLSDVPGIKFQSINDLDRSSFKDFSLYLTEEFPLSRSALSQKLLGSGIQTKPYFYPPIHRQDAYRKMDVDTNRLKVADMLSENCLSIPLYSHMPVVEVELVSRTIKNIVNGTR